MKIKGKQHKTIGSIVYLKLFLLGVLLLTVLSIAYRGFLWTKGSKFTDNTYTLLVFGENSYLIHVDKRVKKFSLIQSKSFSKPSSGDVRLSYSVLFGVPIDGMIVDKGNTLSFHEDFIDISKLVTIFTQPLAFSFYNANSLDLLKIYFALQKVPASEKKSISNHALGENARDLDKELFSLFKDSEIINEKTSVEIVNAAHIDGLAGKVSRMLKNVGFNVVSVISTDAESRSKLISRIDENFTIKSLATFFGIVPEYKNGVDVADVTLMVGKDLGKKLVPSQ